MPTPPPNAQKTRTARLANQRIDDLVPSEVGGDAAPHLYDDASLDGSSPTVRRTEDAELIAVAGLLQRRGVGEMEKLLSTMVPPLLVQLGAPPTLPPRLRGSVWMCWVPAVLGHHTIVVHRGVSPVDDTAVPPDDNGVDGERKGGEIWADAEAALDARIADSPPSSPSMWKPPRMGLFKREVLRGAIWPTLLHVFSQPLLEKCCGPRAMVLCATDRIGGEVVDVLRDAADRLQLIVHAAAEPTPPIPADRRADVVVGTPRRVLQMCAANDARNGDETERETLERELMLASVCAESAWRYSAPAWYRLKDVTHMAIVGWEAIEEAGQGEDVRRIVLSHEADDSMRAYGGTFRGPPAMCQFVVTCETDSARDRAIALFKEFAATCTTEKPPVTIIPLAPLEAAFPRIAEKRTRDEAFEVRCLHVLTPERFMRNPDLVTDMIAAMKEEVGEAPCSARPSPGGHGIILRWNTWNSAARCLQRFHGKWVDDAHVECEWGNENNPPCPSLVGCQRRGRAGRRSSWLAPPCRASDACACVESPARPPRRAGGWLPVVAIANVCHTMDELLRETSNEYGPTGRCLLHDVLEECHMCGDISAYATGVLPPGEGDCTLIIVEVSCWSVGSDIVRLMNARTFNGREVEAAWCCPDLFARLAKPSSIVDLWRITQASWEVVEGPTGCGILRRAATDDDIDIDGLVASIP